MELACGRSPESQLATFGHELQHAVEIADARDVIDARTLAWHYQRIGFRASSRPDTFETEAARDAGLQIRREIVTGAGIARTNYDRD